MKNHADIDSGDDPSDTTLTPLVLLNMLYENSQKQGQLERKDADGDIKMKDEEDDETDEAEESEVREIRERLS